MRRNEPLNAELKLRGRNRVKKFYQFMVFLLVGALIGYGLGLLLSFFKTEEGLSTYNFQTKFVPEIFSLLCLIPALLLFLIIRSKQNISYLYQDTLQTLAMVIERKDRETEDHCRRVTEYAMVLGEKLGIRGRLIQELGWGAYLHDLGKISIPDSILLKPEKLNSDEWQVMKSHVQEGYRLLEKHDFLGKGLDVILFHHEKYDGSGYPFGLRNNDIPFFARIFSVVDAFDAITSNRPYHKGRSIQEAKHEIAKYAGTQFCPKVVQCFMEVPEDQLKSILEEKNHLKILKPLHVSTF